MRWICGITVDMQELQEGCAIEDIIARRIGERLLYTTKCIGRKERSSRVHGLIMSDLVITHIPYS